MFSSGGGGSDRESLTGKLGNVVHFYGMTDPQAILANLQVMSPMDITAALDRTRAKQTSRSTSVKYDDAVWKQVWEKVKGGGVFADRFSLIPLDTMIYFDQIAAKDDYYSAEIPTLDKSPGAGGAVFLAQSVVQFPHLHLSRCLHYYAHVSNVQAYVGYQEDITNIMFSEELALGGGGGGGNQQETIDRMAMKARQYCEHVLAVLSSAKAPDAGKALTVTGLVQRPKQTDLVDKLYYRLFGLKSGGVTRPLLYLPVEFLFHDWTSVNLDGRAFRLFLTMPEFTWVSVKHSQALSRVRVTHESHTLTLNVSTLGLLSVISVKDGPLLSRNRASYILGPVFADPMRNLNELILVNLPSAVFPQPPADGAGFSMPRLQTFHIENVSRGRSVTAFISAILSAGEATIQRVILAGPDLLVSPDMASEMKLPTKIKSLTIKVKFLSLQDISVEIVSFPRVGAGTGQLEDLVLGSLPPTLSDLQYRLLTRLSPVSMTMDNLPIDTPSFNEMMRVADPDRLASLTLINMHVYDLSDALGNKRMLKKLAVALRPYDGPKTILNVPVKAMSRLAEFFIDKVSAEQVKTRLTGSTFSEWMRQLVIAGSSVSSSASGGEVPGASKRKLEFDASPQKTVVATAEKQKDREEEEEEEDQAFAGEKEEVTETDIESMQAALEDMYEPFGSKGPGLYPDRMPPSALMNNPNYPLRGLLMSTWLEWDEHTVAWLADEHGEGLSMDAVTGDALFKKTVDIEDGNPYSVTFSSNRKMKPQRSASFDSGEGELKKDEVLDAANESFWNAIDSQTTPFPCRLELVCKEKTIGRSETTGAPIIDGSVHLIYPLNNGRRFSLSNARAVQQTGGGLATETPFMYAGQEIGTLTRRYETTPSGYKFIVGFSLRLVIGDTVKMMVTEDALLLATRSVGVAESPSSSGEGARGDKSDKDAAIEAESIAEAETEGLPAQLALVSETLLFPGREARFTPEEIVRSRVLTNMLYTTNAISTGKPFSWDEEDDRMLTIIQQDPERLMFGNWMTVAYFFTVGLSHLLTVGGFKTTADLRDHWRSRLYEKLLLPVARWCLAYSPPSRVLSSISSEESLLTVEGAGDRLLALIGMIQTAVTDEKTPDDELVSITSMLSPPVFGADDDNEDEADNDESVMQFVQAMSDFEDAVNTAMDNEFASSGFDERVGQNRRLFITATKKLTDIYLLAQEDYSGDGKFLDYAKMAGYMRRVFSDAAGKSAFSDAKRAIAAIKRDLVDEVDIDMAALSPVAGGGLELSPSPLKSAKASPGSPGLASSPLLKKSKLIVRDSSPKEVAAAASARVQTPVKLLLAADSPSSPRPPPRKEISPGKRFKDTRLAVALSPPRRTPVVISLDDSPSVDEAPVNKPSKPLPGLRENPIVL